MFKIELGNPSVSIEQVRDVLGKMNTDDDYKFIRVGQTVAIGPTYSGRS